ncbi:VanZ family protein [Actinomyces trachealis]|uniref:VanZ family protein n=1 Tax=Actinomyces trachealis TaxID=2763540 RepID=UPI001892C299|nr:VanZ family protein [Actinomyces trachealis]
MSEKSLSPKAWIWLVRAGWLVYLIVVLVAVLWPSGQEVSEVKNTIGPPTAAPEHKDISLNLVMLTPYTFLGMLGWPRLGPWFWCLAGAVFAVGAEGIQFALPALTRRASMANVFQNSFGAVVGVLLFLLAAWVARRLSAR